MVTAMERLNRDEAEDLVGETVRFGIGLHLGEVITGNIGSAEKMEYSVIGDTVNITARVHELTRDEPPGTILLGDTILEQTKDLVEVEALAPVTLRGRSEATQLYRVVRGRD